MWLTLHASLPTNTFDVSIVLFDFPCDKCSFKKESTLHLLRDDHLSRRLKQLELDPGQDFLTLDCNQLLYTNINNIDEPLFIAFFLLAGLYRRPRTHEFSKINLGMFGILSVVFIPYTLIIATFYDFPTHNPCRHVRWEPPSLSDIKVNADGSSFGNPGKLWFGGFLWDSLGHWILGFFFFLFLWYFYKPQG